MRNPVPLTVLMTLVAPLATSQAVAAGAGAIGIAPGGASQGYASGFSVNAANIETAKAQALGRCRKPENNISGTASNSGTLAAKAECQVVVTFVRKCYAEALDPQDGTPGAGWATADTQQAADDAALARCQATAGADRRAFCKVVIDDCDRGDP